MAAKYYGKKAVRDDDDIMICAGDVETDGLGGKLLMVQWGYFGQVFHATGPDMIDQFFNAFFEFPKPAVWFFHFGQYDWRYFLDHINKNPDWIVEIGMRTDTDIYEIRIKRHKQDKWSVMRDSYALWSHKLEDLAKSFCPELPKLELDFSTVQFDPTNEDHIRYARRDVEILLKGLPRLFDMVYDHFGVYPTATAAGTAMKAWQYSLPYKTLYDCSEWGETEQFIREGYYGGLVFLTTTQPNKGAKTYDRNSSYPAVMRNCGVPCGKPIYTNDFEDDFPGIYRVRVRAPDGLVVPILPARNKAGSMRWYRGEFETVVTTPELEFAVLHGYEVLEVYEGVYFSRIEYPHREFITLCEQIRIEYKGETPEWVAKLMQNSLYGRFASARNRTRMLHHTEINEDLLIGATPFDETGLWYVTKELSEDMQCLPQWAVFITAHARLALLEEVYKIGPENVLYGDTDSITVKGGIDASPAIGREYGEWKLEKEWEIFKPIAPKVYVGITTDGKFVGAAKGMPKKAMDDDKWNQLLDEGKIEVTVDSLDSLKVSMRKGVRPSRKMTRKSTDLQNSVSFALDGENQVRVRYAHE